MFAFRGYLIRCVNKVAICYRSGVVSPGFTSKHWKNERGADFSFKFFCRIEKCDYICSRKTPSVFPESTVVIVRNNQFY